MKRKIFLAASLFLVVNVMAQKVGRFKYHSINNVGVVEGGSDANLQLQTINGIQYKTFFGGVGLGLDNYYFKTIPLFVDLRKNFFEKKLTPFAYVDFGADIPWDRAKVESWSTSYYKTGFFYDMGLGYSIPIKGRLALNISAGYSEKNLNETRETSYWIWRDFPPYDVPSTVNKDTTYYKYTLRRFSFKIGLSF
jgi:hypothetical protein